MIRKYDLVGQQFGWLTVLEYHGNNERGEKLWSCKCKCGNLQISKTANLTSGRVKSCGCGRRGDKRNDDAIVGKKFNNFTVIKFVYKNKWRELVYKCKCDCGNTINVKRPEIGKMKSCPRCKWDDYEGITHGYWSRTQKGALVRNLEFNITKEYAWQIFIEQNKKCILSGVNIVLARTHTKKQTASIDRINSKIGYIIGNIQWVHKDINRIKWDKSNEEIIDWSRKIVRNIDGKHNC